MTDAAGSSSTGLFHDDSTIRAVGQEALSLLGGGRAVLMQLAHPLVAAGVADHSAFQGNPLLRLEHTLDFMHVLMFGNHEQVQAALREFHARHRRIHGRLPKSAGPYAAGITYRAEDPQLKLWVHATLTDSGWMTYERFVAPIPPDEREEYYAETRVVARLLGIPDPILPQKWGDFQEYMAAMLASDTLAVTKTARTLAEDVLNPSQVGPVAAGSARLLRFVTAGLLPEPLREAYGFEWSAGDQRRLDHLSMATRALRPRTPRWVWQGPRCGPGIARALLSDVTKGRQATS
ncbi:MAG: DUF2236 domain-containing protein [Chloroflexota bacterium]|nr:DUF2236 domain-containing protein [Chloroflexota bacterium]